MIGLLDEIWIRCSSGDRRSCLFRAKERFAQRPWANWLNQEIFKRSGKHDQCWSEDKIGFQVRGQSSSLNWSVIACYICDRQVEEVAGQNTRSWRIAKARPSSQVANAHPTRTPTTLKSPGAASTSTAMASDYSWTRIAMPANHKPLDVYRGHPLCQPLKLYASTITYSTRPTICFGAPIIVFSRQLRHANVRAFHNSHHRVQLSIIGSNNLQARRGSNAKLIESSYCSDSTTPHEQSTNISDPKYQKSKDLQVSSRDLLFRLSHSLCHTFTLLSPLVNRSAFL